MHDHRKYHWLYFVLGICIAVVVATLMGCEQAGTGSGVVKEQPLPPPEFCVNGTMEWDPVEEDWLCQMVIIN